MKNFVITPSGCKIFRLRRAFFSVRRPLPTLNPPHTFGSSSEYPVLDLCALQKLCCPAVVLLGTMCRTGITAISLKILNQSWNRLTPCSTARYLVLNTSIGNQSPRVGSRLRGGSFVAILKGLGRIPSAKDQIADFRDFRGFLKCYSSLEGPFSKCNWFHGLSFRIWAALGL